ncbi:hypothetical protein Cyrtocomes_00772 [Candidatus Cyrtobacter comes]|uniref:Uncharacterized protein n=1 Tax=Candidatus Cyrtobacter comes TaxID=675776 RepID=A0ABU5L8E7_9RICK|nr:hypothetical protein [Candidatus Cyrtobacter comes]
MFVSSHKEFLTNTLKANLLFDVYKELKFTTIDEAKKLAEAINPNPLE